MARNLTAPQLDALQWVADIARGEFRSATPRRDVLNRLTAAGLTTLTVIGPRGTVLDIQLTDDGTRALARGLVRRPHGPHCRHCDMVEAYRLLRAAQIEIVESSQMEPDEHNLITFKAWLIAYQWEREPEITAYGLVA